MRDQGQCIDFPIVKMAYKMIMINYEIQSCLERLKKKKKKAQQRSSLLSQNGGEDRN